MKDKEIIYWLMAKDLRVLNPRKIARLWRDIGVSLAEVFELSEERLKSIGLDKKDVQSVMEARKKVDEGKYHNILEELKKQKISVIKYIDKEYPEGLKQLKDPPYILFHKGSLKDFEKSIAIVGTRNASLFGRRVARELSKNLASDFVIVSGLARGIDTEAHCGALEAERPIKGLTLAVLAWMHPIYPRENEELLKDIVKRGAAISENFKKLDGKRAKTAFIKRDRIVSAISRAIIVIETGEKGGTMHTVRYAKKYGKPIFVIRPPQEHFKEKRRSIGGFKVLLQKYSAIEVSYRDPEKAAEFIREKIAEIIEKREGTLEGFIQKE